MSTGPPTISERVAAFPRWHYEFDLAGVQTPIFDPEHRNRHAQRKDYFMAPLARLCGGTLAGRRVLDLGCNAGFWSLQAIESGADFVLGIDGRPMHIDQSNLVFETKGVEPERYRFVAANVFDVEQIDDRPFDVVLNLGLLYHVAKPVELYELIARSGADLVVTDTALSIASGAYLQIRRERTDEPRNALDHELVMHPTRQAVIELAALFGYQTTCLAPRFTSWEGADDYRRGYRRAFISSRSTPLDDLESEPVATPLLSRAGKAAKRLLSGTPLRRLV